MSPQEIWNKIVESVNSKSNSQKRPFKFKNLIILLILGMALMLISHFYSGSKTKPQAQNASQAVSKQTKTEEDATPASLLKNQDSPKTMNDYATYYEDRLTSILDSMAGISDAKVLITLATGPEQVYQQDTKTTDQQTTQRDSNGGTQTTTNKTEDSSTVLIDQANGQKGPLLITQRGPTFKAILVVAKGVSHPAMQERVINAVSTVLDVPSYKVSVQERK